MDSPAKKLPKSLEAPNPMAIHGTAENVNTVAAGIPKSNSIRQKIATIRTTVYRAAERHYNTHGSQQADG